MNATNGKIESFVAHEKFIIDGISRQAGTLEKALLEGGMNGFEAGSERVDYIFNEQENTLVISDKGRGFRSRQEIQEWFRTFGTPHKESEGKKWAEFRMGRGQMFSFGHNTWRTGEFRIVFDLKTPPSERDYPSKNVLDYFIEEGLPHHQGCEITIKLYQNPICHHYASVGAMKSAIKKHMEFMEGIITFNGEQINTPASELNWDIETDDAYFMFGKGRDLTIYNMGAYVLDRSAADAGVTGVVVSKEKLKVNFARNSVMYDCEVYQRINEVVRANKIKRICKARRYLGRHERMSMLVDLRDGSGTYKDSVGLGLVPLTNDRVMSLRNICKIRQPWTFAEHGDQRADTLMVRGAAVVFDKSIMQELDYPFESNPQDFFVWLLEETFKKDRTYRNNGMRVKWEQMRRLYQTFSSDGTAIGLADGFSTTKTIIPEKEWTKVEKRMMKALSKYGYQWKSRTLLIGQSDTALAWTDGKTYIALDRLYLRRLSKSRSKTYSACHLVAVLLHETAHDDSTVDSHHHNFGFYKAFHDIVSGNDNSLNSPMGIAMVLPSELRRLEFEEDQIKKEEKEAKQKKSRDLALGLTAKKVRKSSLTNPVKKKVLVDSQGRPRKRKRI